MDLKQKKCVPCEIGTPPFTKDQYEPLLKQLKLDWEVIEEKKQGASTKLRREFKFKDFVEAISFVNKVADLAEEEGHHPNFHIYYSRVVVDLYTHKINGLSENDFILAAKIEELSEV